MPTQRITFTGGVVQAEGAPLSAPYALENAYLEPGGTARALLEGSAAEGVPEPEQRQRLFRHAGSWVAARDGAYRRGLFYALGVAAGDLEVYSAQSDAPEPDVPRILSASTSDSGRSSLNTDRYIIYCLIPVNERDEAGPWSLVAHKTGSLPDISVNVSDATAHVEAYRTAEINVTDLDRRALAWYYLGKFASGSFEGSSAVPGAGSYDTWADPDATGIDSFDIGTMHLEGTEDAYFEEADVSYDLTGWTVLFADLRESGTLQEGTYYEIYSHTGSTVSIKEVGAADGSLSFDGEQVAEEQHAAERTFLYSATAHLNPPEGGGGTLVADVVVDDTKLWDFETATNDELTNMPDDADLRTRPPNAWVQEGGAGESSDIIGLYSDAETDDYQGYAGFAIEGDQRSRYRRGMFVEVTGSDLLDGTYQIADEPTYTVLYGQMERTILPVFESTLPSASGTEERTITDILVGQGESVVTIDGVPYKLRVGDEVVKTGNDAGTYEVTGIYPIAATEYEIQVDGELSGSVDGTLQWENHEGGDLGELSADTLRRPRARALHYANGRLYAGAPTWPTAWPVVAYSESGTEEVALVYEYDTPNGKRFGPAQVVEDVDLIVSAPQPPATALRIYAKDSEGDWLFYKRLTIEQDGFYEGSPIVFNSTSFASDNYVRKEEPPPATYRVSEESVVLLSNQNRPLELTFEQFVIPSGSRVRAVFPARLAEEEGVAVYEFYVATEREIWVATPGEDVQLRAVTTAFGVGSSRIGTAGVAPVDEGTAIIDTDGRVRLLSGRQTSALFERGTEPWGEVWDLAYDARRGELAILTDTGLWGYSLSRRQIVRQYEVDAEALTYDTDSDELLAYDGDWTALDESGSVLDSALTTQRIPDLGNDQAITAVELDYEKDDYDSQDEATWVTLQHAIRHPAVLQVNEDPDPSKHASEFQAPHGFPVYPRLKGGGHQFKIEQFDTLRDITLRGDATLFEDTD